MIRGRQRLQEIQQTLLLDGVGNDAVGGDIAAGFELENSLRSSKGKTRFRLHNHILLSRSTGSPSTSAPAGGKAADGQSLTELWRTALLSCGAKGFGASGREGKSGSLHDVGLPLRSGVFVVNAFSGPSCSFAVDSAGGLWGWGSGPGLVPQARIKVCQPRPLTWPGRSRVRQISCSPHMCAAACDSGKLWVWGGGSEGQLGLGQDCKSAPNPTMVESMSGWFVMAVACGERHTTCIGRRRQAPPAAAAAAVANEAYKTPANHTAPAGTADCPLELSIEEVLTHTGVGSLFTWGSGMAGQLGHGDAVDRCTPTEMRCLSGDYRSLVSSSFQPMGVTAVACGLHHTLAIVIGRDPHSDSSASVSRLFSWGWGEDGRLGLADDDMSASPCMVPPEAIFGEVAAVSAGDRHSLVLTNDGVVYSFGSNEFGQLGCGLPSSIPQSDVPIRVALPSDVCAHRIAASGHHSAIISTCGSLLTWGWGWEGQLGHGVEANRHLPKPVKVQMGVNPSAMSAGVPVPHILALGRSHTLVIVRNRQVPALVDRLDDQHVPHAISLLPSPTRFEKNEVGDDQCLPLISSPQRSLSPARKKKISPKKGLKTRQSATSPGWRQRTIERLRQEDAIRVAKDKEILRQNSNEPQLNEEPQAAEEVVELQDPPTVPRNGIIEDVAQGPPVASEEVIAPKEEGAAELPVQGEEPEPPVSTAPLPTDEGAQHPKDDYYFGGKHQDLDRAYVANTAKRAVARKSSSASALQPPEGDPTTSA